MNLRLILLAIVMAAALCPVPAAADVVLLPAPATSVQCTYDDPTTNTHESVSNNLTACSVTGASTQLALAPFAGVSANATSGDFVTSSGLGVLTYNFEVVGGTVGDLVPLLFTANLQTGSTSHSFGFASITVSTLGGTATTQESACSNEPCSVDAFSGTFGALATVGDVNRLSMEAEATIGFSPDPEDAFASVDPMIIVDPTFANAGQYSIVLSPGVANAVSSVPEPGSFWLVLASALAILFVKSRIFNRRSRPAGGRLSRLLGSSLRLRHTNGPCERKMRNVGRSRIPVAALGAILICLCSQTARADLVTFTGNLTSDGTAVGSGDPVITNPSTINVSDPFSITLNYDPTSFTQAGSSYVLTDASLTLQFDGYSFGYTSAAGNYLEFSSPGAFGAGTTSFLFCSSLANCSSSTQDFLILYFQGTVTSPSTLAAQAGGLSGDPSASPSEFEFLRNFSDGSQTDLQGTLGTPGSSAVPEPSALVLLALAVAGFGGFRARSRRRS